MSGDKRKGSRILAYIFGIACIVWFYVSAFRAAMGPAWDGSWSLTPAVVGFILVAGCAYRADDSLLEGLGGGLFFLFWCWGLWTALPPTLDLVHKKALAAAEAARVSSEHAAVQAVLDSEWERTAKGADVNAADLTYDLPASWPPRGDGRLSSLAYSAGWRPGLPDGQVIGSIWGRIVLDTANSQASFQRFSNSTKQVTIQGVRPMTKEEVRISDSQPEVRRRLIALTKTLGVPKEADPVLRDFYCQWRKLNGVVGRLPSPEADFIRWLGCDRPASPD